MTITRYLFFTGKGGVGKTSVACAMSLNLSNNGKKVLLVSTDPASNLNEVLDTEIGQEPTPVQGTSNLWALNLDPEEAARAYRERLIGPYRDALPEAAVASMEEQLSGACTLEIATFDLFTQLLADSSQAGDYDHIVFDTAPTGHTLRLLSLPKAWTGFFAENTSGTSCIGPLAGLDQQRKRYEETLFALSNNDLTTLVLVTRPEPTSLTEAARASRELKELGLTNQELIVNGMLQTDGRDRVAAIFRQQQEEALQEIPSEFKRVPRQILPLLPVLPVGLEGLRLFAAQLDNRETGTKSLLQALGGKEDEGSKDTGTAADIPSGLQPIMEELNQRDRGIILVMGKGGVGKTTVAAATALALAEKGHKVHLSTTDPAAHLELALAGTVTEGSLSVSHIDQEAEVAAYREEVMATTGAQLDEEGRALLAEDLASPCTEEIAVFRAFARTVARVEEGFVVLDTAPTGHTLLLLDATQSYHRDVERNKGEIPEEVKMLLPRLRDPELTQVLIVTLAQTTPVLEAKMLQEDLRRAEIEPAWWVVNQTWTGVPTTDPVLVSLARAEKPWLDQVVQNLARRAVYIPWQPEPPRGKEGLAQLLKLDTRAINCYH